MSNDSVPSRLPLRVGVFDSVASADHAVAALQRAGFTEDEITVFSSNNKVEEHFEDKHLEPPGETGVPLDHAATGSAIGSAIGGLTAVATLSTVAGIPVIVAGGMASLLTGGVVGGLAGAMMNRGLEKESADYFDQAVDKGKILVSVEPQEESDEQLETASSVLQEAGAEPISLREG